jgi:CRISPR-associated endonuclease Cas1
MLTETTTRPLTVSKAGLLVVGGFSPRLFVQGGHLVADASIGRDRQVSRFHKATSGLKRVCVIGRRGYVSLSALEFLADAAIPLVVLHSDGRPLVVSAGFGLNDGRLRLAQAAAWGTPTALGIARDLLGQKLDAQARIVVELPGGHDAAARVRGLSAKLFDADSVDSLMIVEAAASAEYFARWSALPVPWARADLAKVPEHWLTVGPRTSPLTGSPRLSVGPVQSVANYLMGIVEAEARLACLAQGLDPAIPTLHSPLKGRDNLALDLEEAVRGEVDRFVLEMLNREVFRRRDFHETPRGNVRILPPLTHRLAETAPMWARHLGPVVEHVARAFADSPGSRVDRLPSRLTEDNRSAGRDGLRRGPRRRPLIRVAQQPKCVVCGDATSSPGRSYCPRCLPEREAEQIAEFQLAGSGRLAELRLAREDPAHGGDVAAIRGRKWSERHALERDWEANHDRADPQRFRTEILPGLRALPTRRLVEATGLTRAYCSLIRKGELVPHPRHWEVLRMLGPA